MGNGGRDGAGENVVALKLLSILLLMEYLCSCCMFVCVWQTQNADAGKTLAKNSTSEKEDSAKVRKQESKTEIFVKNCI